MNTIQIISLILIATNIIIFITSFYLINEQYNNVKKYIKFLEDLKFRKKKNIELEEHA